MKKLLPSTILFCCLFVFITCKKDKQDVTPVLPPAPIITQCMAAEIEAFKQSPNATHIVRIDHPDGVLYWFIHASMVDEGEPILNENCELVCTEDCECGGPIVLCQLAYMNFPMDTIWAR